MPHLPPFSLVLGLDARTLGQLAVTLPTWRRHKPSLFRRPVVAFHDRGLARANVAALLAPACPDLVLVPWPPAPVEFAADPDWHRGSAQRTKMLSGFVHVAAQAVETQYWLKLDVDVVATGRDDWADPAWFDDAPAIVGHRWGYTKPANQMLRLDQWVLDNHDKLHDLWRRPSLGLAPAPGSRALPHARIISWCGFFRTDMTRAAAQAAAATCGPCRMPVPSQDGFLWYYAARMGERVVRVNMKQSFEHWNTEGNIRAAAERAMRG